MCEPARDEPGLPPPAAPAEPAIAVVAGRVITGTGFLPDHHVTIRITYTAEDISDYLVCTTDPGGCLHAELSISATAGALRITATDHRADPDGPSGLLWSNAETVDPSAV